MQVSLSNYNWSGLHLLTFTHGGDTVPVVCSLYFNYFTCVWVYSAQSELLSSSSFSLLFIFHFFGFIVSMSLLILSSFYAIFIFYFNSQFKTLIALRFMPFLMLFLLTISFLVYLDYFSFSLVNILTFNCLLNVFL